MLMTGACVAVCKILRVNSRLAEPVTNSPHMPLRGAGWQWHQYCHYLMTFQRLPRACCGQACIRNRSPVLEAAVGTIVNAGFHRLPRAQNLHRMPAPSNHLYIAFLCSAASIVSRKGIPASFCRWPLMPDFSKGLLRRNSTKHAPANKTCHHDSSSSNGSALKQATSYLIKPQGREARNSVPGQVNSVQLHMCQVVHPAQTNRFNFICISPPYLELFQRQADESRSACVAVPRAPLHACQLLLHAMSAVPEIFQGDCACSAIMQDASLDATTIRCVSAIILSSSLLLGCVGRDTEPDCHTDPEGCMM